MAQLESLYVVEFGDILAPGSYRNGGVVILETNRIFGGDSGYYYVGSYSSDGTQITANVKIVKHDPAFVNVFGDAAQSFNAKMQGNVANGIIQGHMERVDRPGVRLPVRLTWKENLP